jgi:hypothetical protein
MTARVALILTADGEPPRHEQGVAAGAKLLRDHVNITTANSLSVDESIYITRDVLRAYLKEQL